ncbi:PRC-barrel domain-containing protein [Desulfomonile tiedjei]|uniref:PRC-barrel protein n=1 Tax=Desulfomonile tiedjei (strain ATCC 49306 / DSM 6799 / DCB-1) TaxID=706587 RepID=I4C8V2_DESTA|nr:PRC-barrel domain-containing protein [Desulfomonile tiedjei]AFM25993.1 PRC-barrel protein [Desulfomonile tiedjei DSM 6799]
MKNLRVVFISALLMSFLFVSGASADFYVVKDKMGTDKVIEGLPGIGWTVIFGPFSTSDAAYRAAGIGRDYRMPGGMSGMPAPSVNRPEGIIAREGEFESLETPFIPGEMFVAREFESETFPTAPATSGRRSERAASDVRESGRMARGAGKASSSVMLGDDLAKFDVIPASVVDNQNHELGKVEHIVISKIGNVEFIILSHDGKLIPIPWDQVNGDAIKDKLVLNVKLDQLNNAPDLKGKDLQALAGVDFQNRVFNFFETGGARAETEMGQTGTASSDTQMEKKIQQSGVEVQSAE